MRNFLNGSPWAKRIAVEGGQTKHAGMESPEDSDTSEGDAGEESGEGGGRGEDNSTSELRWGGELARKNPSCDQFSLRLPASIS